MLETSNLARKCKPIFSFIKYTFWCLGPLNFADVSVFLQKNSVFCSKKYLYSKQQCESCVRDFLVKVTITENINFVDSVFGIRPLDCSKSTKNLKNDNDVTFSDMTSSSNFFDVFLFLLSSLVTASSFMSISLLVLEL